LSGGTIVVAANCHGAGAQAYYISDEHGFPRPHLKKSLEPPFDADVVVDTLLAAGNGSRAHRAFSRTDFPETISNRRASPSVCNSAVAPTIVRLGRSPMPGSIVRAPHGSWFAIKSSGTSLNFRRGRTI